MCMYYYANLCVKNVLVIKLISITQIKYIEKLMKKYETYKLYSSEYFFFYILASIYYMYVNNYSSYFWKILYYNIHIL